MFKVPAPEFNVLQLLLRQSDGRRRRQELMLWMPRVGLAVALVSLMVAFLSRVHPFLTRGELARGTLIAFALAVTATTLIIFLRRRSPAEQAVFADRQFRLQERMIAAVEIQEGRLSAAPEMAARQLSDAVAAATTVNPASQFPLKWKPAEGAAALAALALLVAVLFLPNPQEAVLLEQKAVTEEVARQVEVLAELSESLGEDAGLTAEQGAQLRQPIDQALTALQEPGLSREEAVAALSMAETELRRLGREFEETAASKALADAAANPDGGDAASGLNQALRDGQLAEASAAAGALGEALAGMDDEALLALGEELADLAAALAQTGSELSEPMSQAADALAAGDIPAARAALDEASAMLGDQAQAAAAAARATSIAGQLEEAKSAIAQSGAPDGAGGEDTAGGSTNDGPGDSGATGATGGQQTGPGGAGQGGGHVESVYVPPPAELVAPGQALELEVQCLGDPASCGPAVGQSSTDFPEGGAGGSRVPYDRVFGVYRDAAFEALSGNNIPLNLQEIVRNYFASLEP